MSLKNNDNNKKSNIGLIAAVTILIVLAIVGVFFLINFNKENENKNMPYTELLTKINERITNKYDRDHQIGHPYAGRII